MKYNGSSWSTMGSTGFSLGTVFNPSIGVDKHGNVYVAYNDIDLSTKAILEKYTGSAWAEVGSSGGFTTGGTDYTQMTMDSHGNPYIVYSDTSSSGAGKASVMRYMVNTAVPIVQTNKEQLTVFPNPTHDQCIIQSTATTNFNIVNLLGQTVKQGKLDNTNNFSTRITGLMKGVYFITTDTYVSNEKLVID